MRSRTVPQKLRAFQCLLARRPVHIIARVASLFNSQRKKRSRRFHHPRGETMSVEVGDLAPDFELKSHAGGTVKLSDFRGTKNVFIAFYPLDWTPV
jgi:AhpC/TSA family